ncbi:MAG TPA: DUF3857 and transglutaminase domain-containing protein [Mucilaginibacter sp.]|nr:DUF3857 and transglutaminase domain-containing protein [Mucilaginibacter sp.]
MTKIKPNWFSCILGFVVIIFVIQNVHCQEKDIPKELYVSSSIPDSLKQDANSVVRYMLTDINVRGPGKVIKKIHSIVTILNERAEGEALVSLPYNRKFSSVTSFEMAVYDAQGKLLKKYHKSDLYEHAADDDETLVTDDKIMIIGHKIEEYPVTVELIYEIDDNSLINIGSWTIEEPEQSVQNNVCHLSVARDAGFRFLNENTNLKPEENFSGSKDVYLWKVSNLKAFKLEDGSMPWRVVPDILFAQNKFEFYGIDGDISNWQNYGKWQLALNSDIGTLEPQRAVEIAKMTDSIKTEKEKVKFLYRYMQQNMRYVNIKLGIGGLKPLPATFVDQKKYGDCKALSNYMCALLKTVNIPSYYAMVNSGTNEQPAYSDFPFDNFDHIILCVPLKNDTVWLECTSNIAPFGALSPFTQNRNALLVTNDGGKLVNTPKSKASDNRFISEVYIKINADGSAKTKIKLSSGGEYRLTELPSASLKTNEQKEFWLNELSIKQPDVFDLAIGQDANGIAQTEINLEYSKFCDVIAGDKQFYKSLAFPLWNNTVPIAEKRKSDYYFNFPMQKSCVTTIDVPEGYEVESLPANASLKFTYGNYNISYVYNKDKNQVVSDAKFVLNNQVVPAAKYTEMQQYMDAVVKAQNKKLVLRKKA